MLILILIIPLLLGAACTSKSIDNEENSIIVDDNENTNTNYEEAEQNNSQVSDTMNETDINYDLYENKATSYQVLIPEKWYWQHFMKNDLTNAGVNKAIDDYLIIDKNPLIGFGSEYLGRIVIEKSNLSLADLEKDMSDYTSTKTNIAGQVATRFELQTGENDYLPNTKLIQYHFTKDGQTFRIMYQMSDSDEQNEAIFERVANSFTFNK